MKRVFTEGNEGSEFWIPASLRFLRDLLSNSFRFLDVQPFAPTRNSKFEIRNYRTANADPVDLRLSALITENAPNISDLRNDEWFVVAPIGEFPSPDGSYTQILNPDQAGKIIKTWNSIAGKAGRLFKNMMHGLGAKFSMPVFDGHPETNKDRWPVARLLAEISDLRVTGNALEGKLTWNEKGMARRTQGPLYPSPLWWHEPPNDERKVFPELLESIGLVPTPNIASVPAWTQNASPHTTDNQNQNPMNEEQLKALRKSLNLPDNTPVEKVLETAQSAYQLSTSNATALQTANSAKTELENKLTTANGQVTTLTTERDQVKTANATLTTERDQLKTANDILVDGVLDAFELAGKITPAQRPETKTKFTANIANSAAVITELKTKKEEVNTKHLELTGNRIDISTANARQNAVQSLVSKRMESDKCDYNVAYDRVAADPANKQLFDAMADPTKKAA